MSNHLQDIAAGLATEFAEVLGNLLGTAAASHPFKSPVQTAWTVPCRISAPAVGTLRLGLPQADASALAARLLMSEGEPGDADVTDALTEVVGQAFAALVTKDTVAGLAGAVERPSRGSDGPTGLLTGFACVVDENLTTHVLCWFEAQTASLVTLPAVAGLSTMAAASDAAPAKANDNLDVILDIDMPLSVRFGEAVLSLDLLTRLGPGSLIELSRQPDDPVDVLINGRLVARGEVVVVSGNYGVRITEVVSAAERLRSVGA